MQSILPPAQRHLLRLLVGGAEDELVKVGRAEKRIGYLSPKNPFPRRAPRVSPRGEAATIRGRPLPSSHERR